MFCHLVTCETVPTFMWCCVTWYCVELYRHSCDAVLPGNVWNCTNIHVMLCYLVLCGTVPTFMWCCVIWYCMEQYRHSCDVVSFGNVWNCTDIHVMLCHSVMCGTVPTLLLLALPLFSSQHKNSSHLYPCLFQCCSSLSIHNGPLLHYKLKIQYYRIPSHITFASTCRCRQKCNVLYLSWYSTFFIHTIGYTKTKHFNTITAAQSVFSTQ